MASPELSRATGNRKAFERFYVHAYGRNVLAAMLVVILTVLASGIMDWLFQPQQLDSLMQARVYTLTPMILLAALSSLRRLRGGQQIIIVIFTVVGCIAVLELARRSIAPYNHYYTNGIVLVVLFCFMLTRILFRFGVLCVALIVITCNLYWLGVDPQPVNLLVVKNFILAITCVYSLMAAWTLETAVRAGYDNHEALEQERDELLKLRRDQKRETWLQTQLGEYQVRISGDQRVDQLFATTLEFLGNADKVGFGAGFWFNGTTLLPQAGYALPGNHPARTMASLDPGEGLTGEAMRHEGLLVVDEVPLNYSRIGSGTGDMRPKQLIFLPVRYENESHGVIELALIEPISKTEMRVLRQVSDRFAHALVVAETRHPAPPDVHTAANGD